VIAAQIPEAWAEWYQFARTTLDYERDEAVQYANVRHVEQQNRVQLALEKRLLRRMMRRARLTRPRLD
jgi:hypothetical protein